MYGVRSGAQNSLVCYGPLRCVAVPRPMLFSFSMRIVPPGKDEVSRGDDGGPLSEPVVPYLGIKITGRTDT